MMFFTSTRFTLMPHLSVASSRMAVILPLNTLKLQAEAEKNDVLEQLQAALAENTRLNNQLTELQNSRAAVSYTHL